MSTEPKRTSQDLALTLEAFRACGWKAALGKSRGQDYASMWRSFMDEGHKVDPDGHSSRARILRLFADACSMMLSPESASEPFKPLMQSRTHRWIVPDDLNDSDVAFFAEIVGEIDDPRLAARLADLVWLRQRPRDPQFALTAIDNYRAIPLTADSWFAGGRECWERAKTLVKMLGKGSENRESEITGSILDAFRAAQSTDDFLGLQLAEFVSEFVTENKERLSIACRLRVLAEQFGQSGNQHAAREYYDGASVWYGRGGDEQRSTAMIVAAAECWVKEGDEKLAAKPPSHTAAGLLYERAIQKYRSIPRSERGTHDVDKRLVDLRTRVRKAGSKSLEEMSTIEAPAIDVGAIVDESRRAVTGKETFDALATYVNLYPGINAVQLRKTAIQNLQAHPLQGLLSTVVLGDDGRIVAKRPGMDLNDMDSENTKAAIHSEMVNTYVLHVHSAAYGVVLPGLEILRLEHRLREGDFATIAARSPAVPPGRGGLFGKALFAGYDWDFVTAIHILAPQVEHMIRFHLKKAGIQTTTLDPMGVETENGLSALMGIPAIESILGENMAFEVKTLFCDSTGPNIRNDVAHGLFSEEKCRSTTSIYAWWLGLKMVFNPLRHALHLETRNEGSESDGTGGDGE